MIYVRQETIVHMTHKCALYFNVEIGEMCAENVHKQASTTQQYKCKLTKIFQLEKSQMNELKIEFIFTIKSSKKRTK